MAIFERPCNLVQVTHFTVPRVRTWGHRKDANYRQDVLEASGLPASAGERFDWFVFCIRCVVGHSRGRWKDQVPDVENIPKWIVDAFVGTLYPDDNLHHVRGVQVKA